MGGRGSGGHNKRTLEEHLRRNTFRPGRHSGLSPTTPGAPVDRAARRRLLRNLEKPGRDFAKQVLSDYDSFTPSQLAALRHYCELEDLAASHMARVAESGPVVTGPGGALHEHRLLAAIRAIRRLQVHLAKTLQLEEAE